MKNITFNPLSVPNITVDELFALKNEVRNLPFPAPSDKLSSMSGSYLSKKRGRGMEFDQVRPYFAGDDIRRIDWKITAKVGQPHTKLFYDEKERPVFIITEQTQPMFFSTTEQLKSVIAAQLTGLIAWGALNSQDRIGGLVFNETDCRNLSPKLTQRNLLQFLTYLAEFNEKLVENSHLETEPHDPLFEALKRAKYDIKPGTLIFVVIDERSLSPESQKILTLLSYQNDLILLPIYDPIDRMLPKVKNLNFSQGARKVSIDGTNPKIIEQYQALVNNRLQRWRKLKRDTQGIYFPISTQAPVLEQITEKIK